MSKDLPERLPPPPRALSTALRLRLMMMGVGLAGWWMIAIGGLFAWIFAGAADWSALHFHGGIATATGAELGVQRTGYSEGGGKKRPGHPIYAHRFHFIADDGTAHDGVSYSRAPAAVGAEAGATPRVEIEYPSGQPRHARIVGMRGAPFSAWLGLTAVLPAIGVMLAVWRIAIGTRIARTLAIGDEYRAKLASKQWTNVKINGRNVIKLMFTFTPADGEPRSVTVRSNDPQELTDEAEERVLLLADSSAPALVADSVPGLALGRDDRLVNAPGVSMFWALAVPVMAAAGNIAYAVWVFTR